MKLKNLLCLSILTFYPLNLAHSADVRIEEYGIAITLENNCTDFAQSVNLELAQSAPELENTPNKPHVTLYQGAFNASDIPLIKAAISNLKPTKLNVYFNDFDDEEGRWINWNIKNNQDLQKLHETIVNSVNSYHTRPLNRAWDVFRSYDDKEKEEVKKYGLTGVMENYKPHLTVFYAYPVNKDLQKMPEIIKNKMPTLSGSNQEMICQAKEIVIGKLGYNGNMIATVDTIPFFEVK